MDLNDVREAQDRIQEEAQEHFEKYYEWEEKAQEEFIERTS
jgi:hypothetical protein